MLVKTHALASKKNHGNDNEVWGLMEDLRFAAGRRTANSRYKNPHRRVPGRETLWLSFVCERVVNGGGVKHAGGSEKPSGNTTTIIL